jgi:nucleoporin NUP82
MLEGSEGGYATDLSYLSFDELEDDDDEERGATEHLGVILIAFQDGKVDVCLDVEKVEAKWELKVSWCHVIIGRSNLTSHSRPSLPGL